MTSGWPNCPIGSLDFHLGRTMNVFIMALILAPSFIQPRATGAKQPLAENRPISVSTAFSLCRAHPAAQERLWIRGWFVASIRAYRDVEGGLFSSRRAVPATPFDRWDVNGNWKRYGALYVHITTQASFG